MASLCETLESSKSLCASSGVLGVGYYSGKALKWLGEQMLIALEDSIIMKRLGQHRRTLRLWNCARWEKMDSPERAMKKQKELFAVIEDVLELSK